MQQEQPVQMFYCPYDLTIQTSNIIWEAKQRVIKELKEQGYKDIDVMISL